MIITKRYKNVRVLRTMENNENLGNILGTDFRVFGLRLPMFKLSSVSWDVRYFDHQCYMYKGLSF